MNSKSKIFSSNISRWYIKNGRKSLPWRNKITPYKIWISEIMLQQTQVKTAIPYFKKFISKYPNLKSLSIAEEEDIMALWSGLGFYRRAKNIFKTKEIIKNQHNNILPKTFDQLIQLPGIGKSTAGAIMSIAYKIPTPILDANVKRVIARYNQIDLQKKSSLKDLWSFSKIYTPSNKIFEYTQGIMDIGATICNIKKPKCNDCPLNKSCKTAFKDLTFTKKTKLKKSKKKIFFKLAHSNNSFLLFKKNEKSFWESLWTPYEDKDINTKDLFRKPLKSHKKNFNHALSHIDLDITIEIFDYKTPFRVNTSLEHQWIKRSEIENYGLPKPIKHIIEKHV